LRLTDGTNKIADAQYVVAGTGGPQSTLPLCGIYNAASTSPVTLKIQSASNSTNTVTIGGTASTDSTIEWSIFSLDQNLPAPVLVGSVTSQSTGAERIERALISNTANPCSITSQSGPFGLG